MTRQAFNTHNFCAVVLISLFLSGCTQLKIDQCLDDGGRWVEEIGECECTYEERGNYNTSITEEELKACMKPRPEKDVEDK